MHKLILTAAALGCVLMFGTQQANAQPRAIFGSEVPGVDPNDMTILTDSVLGQLCSANEDLAACVPAPYNVPSSMIGVNFQNGGSFGVALCDDVTSCAPDAAIGSQLSTSDQLYLNVTPVAGAAGGQDTLQWCWDSDLEPNVNICQNPASSGGINGRATDLLQEQNGPMDLTSLFAPSDGSGILAPGQWTVGAESDLTVPEPASLMLLGAGVFGLGFVRRRRG